MQKIALAIHDISCVGRCSLTVALPILSAVGVHTAVLPTALLSTHTGEFTGYVSVDLNDYIAPIARHIETLGLPFSAIYTGYLASREQAELVCGILDRLSGADTLRLVDPAFADHGKRYSLLAPDIADGMRKLCARADVIVPNMTEAAFLLDRPYIRDGYDRRYVEDLLRSLAALGAKNVVVTGVTFDDGQVGVAVLDAASDIVSFAFRPRCEGVFHGTGDVFASALLAALLCGKALPDAARVAVDFVYEAIRLQSGAGLPLRYGVPFELALPGLARTLGRASGGAGASGTADAGE